MAGAAGFDAQVAGGDVEGLLDQAAVGDGGAGHVEDDQVDGGVVDGGVVDGVPVDLIGAVGLLPVIGVVGHLADIGQLTHQSSSFAVVSAIAGEQVMPRPPGPVTSQTPSRTCCRCTTRAVSVHCA